MAQRSDRTRLLRQLAILAGIVTVCVAVAIAAHWLAWDRPAAIASGESVPAAWLVKPVANFFQTLAAPGWMIVWKKTGATGGLPVTAMVYGVFGVLWYLPLAFVVVTRFLLVRDRPGDGEMSGGNVGDPEAPRSNGRRRLLVDGALTVVAAPTAIAGGRAIVNAVGDLRVREYTVPIVGLPDGLDGIRIAHFSDPHLGPRVPGSFIRSAVDRTLALKPDLVALTGDYVHAGTYQIDAVAELLAPLADPRNVPSGAVGVLGNHDWYADPGQMTAAMGRIGVRMIDNWRIALDGTSRRLVDRPGAMTPDALCIAGLGDLYSDRVLPSRAFGGVPVDMPRLVLAHNPDTCEQPAIASPFGVEAPRIDLMLSGHTHGGQIKVPGFGTPVVPSKFGEKYAGGLVQGPTCLVLISRGVGLSILPVRVGVPPEIGLITLIRA